MLSMISRLIIDNYALINKTIVDFRDGFTVITGETGAGKSIMLDALGLLMGARADSKAIGSKERKMVVEALFLNPDISLRKIFEEKEIDWDDKELILRREISPSGKSRAFVNDTPVNLANISEIAGRLLDIHSQHSNSLLQTPAQQLAIIDTYGRNEDLLEKYQDTFRKYVALRHRIKDIKENIEKGKENREFILFRLEQLDKLKPKRGELIALEREAEILGDADRIKRNLAEATELLGAGSQSALRHLQSAIAILDGMDMELLDANGNDNLAERLNSMKIELRDISDTLDDYSEKIVADPERFEKVNARVMKIYEVMKRFKVKDEDELINLHQQLKEELSLISGDNTDLTELETRLKELAKSLKEHADALTEARIKSAEKISSLIVEKISPLGLPNVKFMVDIRKGKMTADGQDIVTYYCSFNKNHPLQPISEIASGGEISRVMLGIKSVMAQNMKLPTIIFDEIDTGVSGEIAHKMGHMMKEMSRNLQVMAVTHLPQVAAEGHDHLKVYKLDENDKTVSHIRHLEFDERVNEIAGMLSGNSINPIALENARHLLNNA